jgi:Asp-tRNA(Asn)/Glu-tRNA(Gln) amidotransferase C subunit
MTNIEKVAKIARIKIPPEKLPSFQHKFDQVVLWVSEAQKIDCSAFEPMVYVNASDFRTYNNDDFSTIKSETTDDILYNNRLQTGSVSEPEDGHKNLFKTILITE